MTDEEKAAMEHVHGEILKTTGYPLHEKKLISLFGMDFFLAGIQWARANPEEPYCWRKISDTPESHGTYLIWNPARRCYGIVAYAVWGWEMPEHEIIDDYTHWTVLPDGPKEGRWNKKI